MYRSEIRRGDRGIVTLQVSGLPLIPKKFYGSFELMFELDTFLQIVMLPYQMAVQNVNITLFVVPCGVALLQFSIRLSHASKKHTSLLRELEAVSTTILLGLK